VHQRYHCHLIRAPAVAKYPDDAFAPGLLGGETFIPPSTSMATCAARRAFCNESVNARTAASLSPSPPLVARGRPHTMPSMPRPAHHFEDVGGRLVVFRCVGARHAARRYAPLSPKPPVQWRPFSVIDRQRFHRGLRVLKKRFVPMYLPATRTAKPATGRNGRENAA
jgi:hypothetical protein